MSEAPLVRAAVLTVSDAAAAGRRHDESGELAARKLATLPASVVAREVVADELEQVQGAVRRLAGGAEMLVVTGGTGLAPRDVTPQAVEPLLRYQVPGMAEAMRSVGLRSTPHAMLSRQLVGVLEGCLVMVLPGSPRAVAECLEAVWPALPHALRLLAGVADAHAPRETSG